MLSCDLCECGTLEPVYEAGAEGVVVSVCRNCGLVSAWRVDGNPPGAVEMPAAGTQPKDTASLKARRAAATLSVLRQHADLSKPLKVLDAGAGRGAFVRVFLNAAPHAEVTAVEPDQGKAWACAFRGRSTVIAKSIEDARLPDMHFDIVHSCHTLEHVAGVKAMLEDHRRVLKPGGILILEVRNLGAIREDDVIEEWFATNRRTHFSVVTMAAYLAATGFTIVESPAGDADTLLYVAARRGATEAVPKPDALEARSARALVAGYETMRLRNLAALRAVSEELIALAPRGLALWGGGRLLEKLVRHGGLDPQIFSAVIDRSARPVLAPHYGVTLSGPEALSETKPGVIVVMSDAHAGEIARQAQERAPMAEILHYSDLIFRAFDRAAA